MASVNLACSWVPFGYWSDQDPKDGPHRCRKGGQVSQTPFGCWSDQDGLAFEPATDKDGNPSQTPFGCWSDQDSKLRARMDANGSPSQTPFGCWSDQDGREMVPGSRMILRHKRLSAVGPIRTNDGFRFKVGDVTVVTNAFRLLVRSGRDSINAKRGFGWDASQTPFGCWSDQDL